MSKSQSGYEVRLTLWVPADPNDLEAMIRAAKIVPALKTLKFEEIVAIDGAVIEVVEAKSRHISKRAAE